jgi:RNA polymerase primary sigma factor
MCKKSEWLENDITQAYLREVKSSPLLSREEEVELAKRIELGDEQALKLFIQSNLRLVIRFAKIYSRYNKHVQLLDCIQEGNIGLMQAVKGFDWRLGYKFSTYATDWIRQGIMKATISDNGAIHLPSEVGEAIIKLRKTESELLRILVRQPSIEEIAERMGISQEEVLMLIRKMRRAKSLNDPMSDEDDAVEFGDMQPDKASCSVEDLVINKELGEKISQAMDALTEEERQIFLLMVSGDLFIKEIAEKLCLRPEKIRQIYSVAIRKLREVKELKPYRNTVSKIKMDKCRKK